ncbi:Zinc finger CCHC domain-containing protein 3 [Holothuria leucospilota]|uniref:Zinc finger CCHC domain-containing protein 3 n=1 Tax=Holothuria leucospilota TaxID=206669 RepID=A0A9Q1BQV2_HOLLE|nr:Zinc finger CCHC domain-containing protein 3 [Holothuria leucospilota]
MLHSPNVNHVMILCEHVQFRNADTTARRCVCRHSVDMRWVAYNQGDLAGILNGKRQFRMLLKRDIPSFLFIGGSKAHIRYFGQPRTCFKCSEEGHEAKSCPRRRCGRCLQVGHDKAECPNEVRCNLCREEGHVSGACPTSYSARAGADVEQAPEPPQADPEASQSDSAHMVEDPESPSTQEVVDQVLQDHAASEHCESGTPEAGLPVSSPLSPEEAVMSVVEGDLQLSSDSESDAVMSVAGEPVSEPPPKIPPGESWFDLIDFREGGDSDTNLKRSASGEVPVHTGAPTPSPRSKKIKSQGDT